MILIGVIRKPWTDIDRTIITDPFGNQVTLPTTSAISLAFSIMNMTKTIIRLNIIGIHVKVGHINILYAATPNKLKCTRLIINFI